MLRWQLGLGFILDGDLEIDEFLGECAHLVIEAERICALFLSGEDEVALTLLLGLEDDLAARGLDDVVDIECTTGLDLEERNSSALIL